MSRAWGVVRRSIAPDVDPHAASFLGRRVAGMPGPVWSLAAWNLVMGVVFLVSVASLTWTTGSSPWRLALVAYWFLTALVIRIVGARTPSWAIHLVLDLNILVIALTAATGATSTRTFAMLVFLIIAGVYAATWMDRQRMSAHLIVILVASGAVVLYVGRTPDTARAWISLILVCLVLSYFVNALVDHLNQQAVIDPLTGLLNRAGLAVVLAGQDGLGRPQPRVVAALDLDGFKEVNDREGHAAGDALLREVGEVLRAQLRPHDTVVRMGGDEFLVLFSRTEIDQARAVMDRVVSVLPIGCSVGVVEWPEGATLDAALVLADEVMYAEKARHKDGSH